MMDRFFLYRDRILEAYQWTHEFKSLFEDSYSIVFILDNLKQKLLKDNRSELGYRRLFLDLENEVLDLAGTEDNFSKSVCNRFNVRS